MQVVLDGIKNLGFVIERSDCFLGLELQLSTGATQQY